MMDGRPWRAPSPASTAGEEFGTERIQSLLEASLDQPADPFADKVLDTLNVWTSRPPGEGHDDDITLLVIRAG